MRLFVDDGWIADFNVQLPPFNFYKSKAFDYYWFLAFGHSLSSQPVYNCTAESEERFDAAYFDIDVGGVRFPTPACKSYYGNTPFWLASNGMQTAALGIVGNWIVTGICNPDHISEPMFCTFIAASAWCQENVIARTKRSYLMVCNDVMYNFFVKSCLTFKVLGAEAFVVSQDTPLYFSKMTFSDSTLMLTINSINDIDYICINMTYLTAYYTLASNQLATNSLLFLSFLLYVAFRVLD